MSGSVELGWGFGFAQAPFMVGSEALTMRLKLPEGDSVDEAGQQLQLQAEVARLLEVPWSRVWVVSAASSGVVSLAVCKAACKEAAEKLREHILQRQGASEVLGPLLQYASQAWGVRVRALSPTDLEVLHVKLQGAGVAVEPQLAPQRQTSRSPSFGSTEDDRGPGPSPSIKDLQHDIQHSRAAGAEGGRMDEERPRADPETVRDQDVLDVRPRRPEAWDNVHHGLLLDEQPGAEDGPAGPLQDRLVANPLYDERKWAAAAELLPSAGRDAALLHTISGSSDAALARMDSQAGSGTLLLQQTAMVEAADSLLMDETLAVPDLALPDPGSGSGTSDWLLGTGPKGSYGEAAEGLLCEAELELLTPKAPADPTDLAGQALERVPAAAAGSLDPDTPRADNAAPAVQHALETACIRSDATASARGQEGCKGAIPGLSRDRDLVLQRHYPLVAEKADGFVVMMEAGGLERQDIKVHIKSSTELHVRIKRQARSRMQRRYDFQDVLNPDPQQPQDRSYRIAVRLPCAIDVSRKVRMALASGTLVLQTAKAPALQGQALLT